MRRILVSVLALCACGDDAATTDGGVGSDGATPDACSGNEELCGDGVDNNCDGVVDEDCAGGIGTFVSAETGDDANPGTTAMPVKTIGKGIANAMMLGGDRSVIVAEGTYAEKVTLVQGIDLIGGHQCNAQACDFTRDIALYPSTISNTDFEGVLAGAGVTEETLVSGFTITGRTGTPMTPQGTAAVTITGGATLRGNRIAGGTTMNSGETNSRSYGIAIRGAADRAVIENNDIASGNAVLSIGVGVEGSSGVVTIEGNSIRSGSARRSIAVLAVGAATGSELVNNDITSGSSQGGGSVGVHVGSPITVDRNRINLDRGNTGVGTCTQAASWCAAISVEGATTKITNNVALGPRGNRTAGIVLAELELPAGMVTVANNYFDGGGSGPGPVGSSRNTSAAIVLTRSAAAGLTGVVGRIANNILVGGANADRFGIREEAAQDRQIHPVHVTANAFFFSNVGGRSDAFYREIGESGFPIDYRSLFLFEENGPIAAIKNLDENPLVDATFHLTAQSPCIDGGAATDAPARDFEGDARPTGLGIDIGPDERQ